MKIFNQCVFDEYVNGSSNTYTDPKFDSLLGRAEKLSLQVVAEQVSGTSPTVTAQVEHSADQRNWASKNGAAEVAAASLQPAIAGAQAVAGQDAGAVPGLGFLRLRIAMAASTAARLRIFVTGHAEN